jgi:hypothetical protein
MRRPWLMVVGLRRVLAVEREIIDATRVEWMDPLCFVQNYNN